MIATRYETYAKTIADRNDAIIPSNHDRLMQVIAEHHFNVKPDNYSRSDATFCLACNPDYIDSRVAATSDQDISAECIEAGYPSYCTMYQYRLYYSAALYSVMLFIKYYRY